MKWCKENGDCGGRGWGAEGCLAERELQDPTDFIPFHSLCSLSLCVIMRVCDCVYVCDCVCV